MYEEVVKVLSQLKGVERVFPVLGRYDVVADVEASDFEELGSTIMRMGRINGVVFTETLVEIKRG
jgi:DNA-binding Lrp family transcriptional regulator